MELSLSFELKADTEAEAITYKNWVDANYPAYVIYTRVNDMADAYAAGVFPKAWAMQARLTFSASQFVQHKNAFADLLDTHASKIFNFSANSARELD